MKNGKYAEREGVIYLLIPILEYLYPEFPELTENTAKENQINYKYHKTYSISYERW